MPKKIVFLADCLVTQKAGIHFYTKQFIERIINHYPNHEYFIVLDRPYNNLNIGSKTVKEIIVKTKSYIPLHFRWRSISGIPKAVNKIDPDIVIEMAHFGPFRLKPHIDRITFIHDLTPITHPQWHDKTSHLVHKIFLPGLLSKAHYVICHSNTTKQNILEYQEIESDKILVSYPKLKDKLINPQQNNLKRKFFFSVGTMEPRKNYLTLVKGFELFAKKNADVDLFIAGGKGWKSQELYNYIEQSEFKNRIKLMGYVSEETLANLYNNCEALIFPSWFEGFGLPLLEAMQLDKAIIASDIDICREVCADAALYFDNNNHKDLEQIMVSFVSDKSIREKMEKLSNERARYFNTLEIGLKEIFG